VSTHEPEIVRYHTAGRRQPQLIGKDPSGVPIEYFAEMERIYDDRRPVRPFAITDPRVPSIWGPSGDLTALFGAAIPLRRAG